MVRCRHLQEQQGQLVAAAFAWVAHWPKCAAAALPRDRTLPGCSTPEATAPYDNNKCADTPQSKVARSIESFGVSALPNTTDRHYPEYLLSSTSHQRGRSNPVAPEFSDCMHQHGSNRSNGQRQDCHHQRHAPYNGMQQPWLPGPYTLPALQAQPAVYRPHVTPTQRYKSRVRILSPTVGPPFAAAAARAGRCNEWCWRLQWTREYQTAQRMIARPPATSSEPGGVGRATTWAVQSL